MSDVRSVALIIAVITFGSDGTTGPSGSPSTTSNRATVSGRSTRRQASNRQLTVARKNGCAKSPLLGSSNDASIGSEPSASASSVLSVTGRDSTARVGLPPPGDGEIDDVAHDLRQLEVLGGVDGSHVGGQQPG